MSASKKERLDLPELSEMADLAKNVEAMPDGPEKLAAKKEIQDFFNFVLEKRDLPVETGSVLGPIVSILDYIPGLVRTAAGEAALTVAGKNTAEGAKERVANAVVPDFIPMSGAITRHADLPAPSVGEYRKILGGDTEGMQKPLLPENSYLNPTKGGALDFGLNVLLDPTTLMGLKKLATKGAGKGAQRVTMEQAQEQLAKELEKKYGANWMQKAGREASAFATDPSQRLGELLYKWRFKDADKATREAGRKAVSDVLLENGAPGVTTSGIRDSIDEIINRKENNISRIEAPVGENLPTRARSEVLAPLNSDQVNRKIRTPGTTGAYQAARQDILDEFEAAAMQNPGLKAAYEEAKAKAGTRATEGGELLYEQPPTNVNIPGTPGQSVSTRVSLEPEQITRPGVKVEFRPGMKIPEGMEPVAIPGEGIVLVPKSRQAPPTRVVTPEQKQATILQNRMTRTTTNTPGRGVVQKDATPAVNPDPGNILEYADEYYTPGELRDIARNYQQKARASGFYSQPSKFDAKTRANMKAIEENMALGKMQNDVGMTARELEMQALDEAMPGLGGDVFKEYKDISSLMTGAPYLDKPYLTGGAPKGYSIGRYLYFRNPWLGATADIASEISGAAKVAAGKALMSRPGKAAVSSGRASAVENYSEKKRNNPWSVVKKAKDGK